MNDEQVGALYSELKQLIRDALVTLDAVHASELRCHEAAAAHRIARQKVRAWQRRPGLQRFTKKLAFRLASEEVIDNLFTERLNAIAAARGYPTYQ